MNYITDGFDKMRQRSLTVKHQSRAALKNPVKRSATYNLGDEVTVVDEEPRFAVKLPIIDFTENFVHETILLGPPDVEKTEIDIPEGRTMDSLEDQPRDDITELVGDVSTPTQENDEYEDEISDPVPPLKCSTPPIRNTESSSIENMIEYQLDQTHEPNNMTETTLSVGNFDISKGFVVATNEVEELRQRTTGSNLQSYCRMPSERNSQPSIKHHSSIHKSLKDVINRANRSIYRIDTFKVQYKAGLSKATVGLPSLHPRAAIKKPDDTER